MEEEGEEGREERIEVEEEEDSIRRRMKKRRQSRYKRLRGSDESAECHQNGSIEGIEEKQIREGKEMEEENVKEIGQNGIQIRGLELAEAEEDEDSFRPAKC